MLNKIEANESPVINGDGSQAYDFIYVEDVAKCNVAALKSDVDFGMYNVGTEIQTSIRELCDLIIKNNTHVADDINKITSEISEKLKKSVFAEQLN